MKGQTGREILNKVNQHFSFCLSVSLSVVFFGVRRLRMKLDYLLYIKSPKGGRASLSSLHFRAR